MSLAAGTRLGPYEIQSSVPSAKFAFTGTLVLLDRGVEVAQGTADVASQSASALPAVPVHR